MKRTLLLLSLLTGLSGVATAQITIVQGDLPGANTLWVTAYDTGYAGAIPAGGASQAWNYATLNNNEQDSTAFVSAAGTPYASWFPGANLAVISSDGYAYYSSGSTGMFANGIVEPASGVTMVFNPARMIMPVPFTYGSTASNNSRYQIDTTLGGIGYRYVSFTQQSFDGDGYGSLQLPNGMYTSTLRIKETDQTVDSIYINAGPLGWQPLPGYTPSPYQSTQFLWLRNGAGALLLSIGADSLGTTATGGASYFLSSGPAGVVDLVDVAAMNVFPNPASSYVTLDLTGFDRKAEMVYVYDVTGRQIDAMNVVHIDRNTFDVRNYMNGRYIVKITGADMAPVTTSFTVVH